MAETLDAAPTTDLTYDSASWWKRLDAKDDWANTDEDHSIAIGVLGNDVGALGIVKVNDTKITADTPPVTLGSGATVDLDGKTLIYNPGAAFEKLNSGESGSDKFTYTIVGYANRTDTANVSVTIAGENDDPGTNHPPVAVDDKAELPLVEVYEDYVIYPSVEINVLANDKDPDGDPLKVATIAQTKVDTDPTTDPPDTVTLDKGWATVKLNADGSLTYTAGPGDIVFEPLTELDATLMVDSDGSGELVPVDLLPPQGFFDPEEWPVDGFTYTATDDKGAESNVATVTVYQVVMMGYTNSDPALRAEPDLEVGVLGSEVGVLDSLDPLLT